MSTNQQWTNFELDPENDDITAVKEKLRLGSKSSSPGERIAYLNNCLDGDGNTLLMRFIKGGKREVVECLLDLEGLEVNAENDDGDTAAEIARKKGEYICLLMLLKADSLFPKYLGGIDQSKPGGKELVEFVKGREELHDLVKTCESEPEAMKAVKEATKAQKSSFYFNPMNKSLLYRAAKSGLLEVFSYLLFIGARYRDIHESCKHTFGETHKDMLEALLEEYFTRDHDAHLLKLKASSRVLGSYTDERKGTVEKLYHRLDRCKFVSSLMKVAAHQEVDFVFDFNSVHTERIYHRAKGANFGLTDTRIHRISIGAKTCENSLDAKVAGTVAHEMCHLAMEVLYENHAKPYYGEKDEEYAAIVKEIKEKRDSLHDVIGRVFNYNENKWHSELIVRVPHILGIYGETEGKKILLKQVPDLYKYYEKNVALACENYCRDAFYSKPIQLIQSLQKYHGCIGVAERKSHPLKEPSKNFKEYLNPCEKISVLITTNTKLCCMHVYHELKGEYKYNVEKQCLFFKLETFCENRKQITNALRCKACQYIVLVAENETVDLAPISENFWDTIDEDKTAILVIPEDCQLLNASLKEKKILEYEWNDFSEDFKGFLMEKTVNFKGDESILEDWIEEEELSEIISPKDLLRLTNQEGFEIGDGKHLTSHGYNKKYFIERSFVKATASKSIFAEIPHSSAVLVTGLKGEKLQEFGIDSAKVQMIGDLGEEIGERKCIFLPLQETKAGEIFDRMFHSKDSATWLHYLNEEFHWRISRERESKVEKYCEKKKLREEELIEVSDQERVVLISDDTGTGKSTVISDLIELIRDRYPRQWVGRIDLNAFAEHKENPLSLANIEVGSDPNQVMEIFVRMLGFETSLEVYLFRKSIEDRDVKNNIFIDGYDEICPKYKHNVLKLLQTLKVETTMQIWITTRRQERIDLETELNTFSYSMESFTEEQQARFLDRFWKHSLKSQKDEDTELGKRRAIDKIRAKMYEMERSMDEQCDSESRVSLKDLERAIVNGGGKETSHRKLIALKSAIDEVDFTKYAAKFLVNMREAIDEEDCRFSGLPLHLYMFGSVAYDKSLRVASYTNIRGLYSDFVKTKIDIYWREKCRIEAATVGSEYLYEKNKEETARHHKEIARCAVLFNDWDKFHDDGLMKSILDIGMIVKGDRFFHFVHRTIADFFFSEWVAEGMSSGSLEKGLFKDVLIGRNFIMVRRFLNAMFQNKEENIAVGDVIIRELDMKEVFHNFLTYRFQGDEDLLKYAPIWKEIIGRFSRVCDENVTSEFCYATYDFCLNLKEEFEGNVYLLIFRCLDDEMLTKFFDADYEFMTKLYFPWLSNVKAEAVAELLGAMERVMKVRQSQNQDSQIVEQVMELLQVLESFENNVFHMSCSNRDARVFCKVLEFVKGIVGRPSLVEHLTKKNMWAHTVLHCSAMAGAKYFDSLLEGLRSVLDECNYLELLKESDDKGNSFLNWAAAKCHPEEFERILSRLRDNWSGDVLKEILFERNDANESILHFAVRNGEIQPLVELLKLSRMYLETEEEFKEFVMDADEDGFTIIHDRASHGLPLRDLNVLKDFLSPEEISDLMEKVYVYGGTCLHRSFSNRPSDGALDDLRFVAGSLARDSLEELILKCNDEEKTLLHSAAMNEYSDYSAVLIELEEILSRASFTELMGKCDKYGHTVKTVEKMGMTCLTYFKEGAGEEEESD